MRAKRNQKKPQVLIMEMVLLFILAWIVPPSHAATLCVDALGGGGCYPLPSAAVAAAANGDTILIHSGSYQEPGTVNITQTDLKLVGDGPITTVVSNPTGTVFKFSANATGEISGLTITGGGNGILVPASAGPVIIHHNHIVFNSGDGIQAGYLNRGFTAYNNVIRANTGSGIEGYYTTNVAYNNIVTENGSYGIYKGTSSFNSSYLNFPNRDYYSITGGQGDISQDCLFVDSLQKDYRLQSVSPCKDKGNPTYLDADGSYSDMGSFGGPSAALFWPYGNGGPVITNLTVNPPIVPEGGTLSIKATVEIR